ncbi:4Fe-4S dicluster domain-containing protein [Candidatus Bathyarchaeota archaeon]|nr:4Fe-4S dicluster domain-containing protein [Candidatus Bathyarchaeota archaeon]
MNIGLAKLVKELIKNSFRPVTAEYPAIPVHARPHEPGEEVRGRHKFDIEKCVGCGACQTVCSSGAITITDSGLVRVLRIDLSTCIFCGRCRDICPEEGLQLTSEVGLAQPYGENLNSLKVEHSVDLSNCVGCGRPTYPRKQIEAVRMRVLSNLDKANVDSASKDMDIYLKYCPDCRRSLSYTLGTHPRKLY